MPYTLVLLRHGQSAWNLENRFTGWIDVDLTDEGRAQARRGGTDLLAAGVKPDILHTSLQVRATSPISSGPGSSRRHSSSRATAARRGAPLTACSSIHIARSGHPAAAECVFTPSSPIHRTRIGW